ncbi:MAG: metallophosphoesterase family protein [Promethearchaeota archaeon]
MEKSFSILHISDLHFGGKHKYNKENLEKYGKGYIINLKEDLTKDLKENLKIEPDCIVLSGDLTWQGEEKEFEQGRLFLIDLCKEFNLDLKKKLIIVPGNHDIKWKKNVDFGDHRPYKKFLSKLFDQDSNVYSDEYFSMIQKFDDKMKVAIIGINSCIEESEEKAGIGSVGKNQLAWIEKEIRKKEINPDEYLLIAVLHHHLVPVKLVNLIPATKKKFEKREFSFTHDAGLVLNWLIDNNISLVLHGHQHRQFSGIESRITDLSKLNKRILIQGAGSVGLVPDPQDVNFNSYNLIQIDKNRKFKISIRKSKDIERGFGFEKIEEYSVRLAVSIKEIIKETLEKIYIKKNGYLSNYSNLSQVEKTVIEILACFGAIKKDDNNFIINNLDDNIKLGNSFIYSLLAYFKMDTYEECLFKDWHQELSHDNEYSIRQIIQNCEERRLNIFEKKKNLTHYFTPKKYTLIIIIGRKEKTNECCYLLRWHRYWTYKENAYLFPAHKSERDVLLDFSHKDMGVNYNELKDSLEVKELEMFEKIKISPNSGVLWKYYFKPLLIKIKPEGIQLINKKAKMSFSNIEPESNQRRFRWYTKNECNNDKYMQKINGGVLNEIFNRIERYQKNFISFIVK